MNHCRKIVLLWIVMVVALTLSCRKPTEPIDQSPDIQWERSFGTEYWDVGYCVLQTSDGGFIVVGKAYTPWMYLVKTNANGDTIWHKTFAEYGIGEGYYVQQTSDDGYILVGYTLYSGAQNVYLVKTDNDGNQIWSRTYGSSGSDEGTSVQQTNDGGYIIAGWTTSFSNGSDLYLIKADSQGDTLWTKVYGGQGNDRGYSVDITVDGGFIVVGYSDSYSSGRCVYLVKTDSLGDTLWTKAFPVNHQDEAGTSVQETDDGGFIITGCAMSPGNQDVLLMKTDVNGNLEWKKILGESKNDYGNCVQKTLDNGYIVVGIAEVSGENPGAVYVIKTNDQGNIEWAKIIKHEGTSCGYSIQQTDNGGYIIAGSTYIPYRGSDVLLIKLKPEK